jgi:uncharacterized protein YkwD
VGLAFPAVPATKAGLQAALQTSSILPANIGVGVPSTDPVILEFPAPMDRMAVAAGLGLAPATEVTMRWNADATAVTLMPAPRWAVDERYVVHLAAGTALADGGVLAADWRAAFTTQPAPHVQRLRVDGVVESPALTEAREEVMASTGYPDSGTSALTDDLSLDTSAGTRVGVAFSTAMDPKATEAAFRLTPAVPGSFAWEGTTLWFAPSNRLAAGTRYTVSLAGARDVAGNPLGGDASFSFTTREHAQAVTVSPKIGERGVAVTTGVHISFSQPMAASAASALRVTDTATGRAVVGGVTWNPDRTVLSFNPAAALAKGRTYAVGLGSSARDLDGNAVTISWRFTTTGPAAVYRPVPATPGSSSMAQYALNQINAARAQYGRAPLALNSTITAVAYGHAADMLAYNYFSHTSRNGMTYRQRLTAGGVSYGYSGENICYLGGGGGIQATLNWCHAQFWAEPYPGGGNHKDNILSPNYRRIGIGIASGGGKVYVVWDFTD